MLLENQNKRVSFSQLSGSKISYLKDISSQSLNRIVNGQNVHSLAVRDIGSGGNAETIKIDKNA